MHERRRVLKFTLGWRLQEELEQIVRMLNTILESNSLEARYDHHDRGPQDTQLGRGYVTLATSG